MSVTASSYPYAFSRDLVNETTPGNVSCRSHIRKAADQYGHAGECSYCYDGWTVCHKLNNRRSSYHHALRAHVRRESSCWGKFCYSRYTWLMLWRHWWNCRHLFGEKWNQPFECLHQVKGYLYDTIVILVYVIKCTEKAFFNNRHPIINKNCVTFKQSHQLEWQFYTTSRKGTMNTK